MAFGGHDPELAALRAESRQELEELVERLQGLVQAVVVLLVDVEELVGVVGIDSGHLRDDPLPADRRPELFHGYLPPEHGTHRVLHRREDERARVDQGAVEVEEDDREADVSHAAIVAAVSSRTRSR